MVSYSLAGQASREGVYGNSNIAFSCLSLEFPRFPLTLTVGLKGSREEVKEPGSRANTLAEKGGSSSGRYVAGVPGPRPRKAATAF